MKRYRFRAKCLVCDHMDTVMHESKEDYQEISVCPKCNGAFVDMYKIAKYKNSISNEIQIDMINPNRPTIIKLNGQVVKGIVELRYNYDTSTHESPGQHNFTVKYIDKESNVVRTVSANKVLEG